MKTCYFDRKTRLLLILILLLVITGHAQTTKNDLGNQGLTRQLAYNDSLLFNAIFNKCDIPKIEGLLASSFEFYEEKGDMNSATVTGRTQFIENLKKNFCIANAPKMRREVRKETVQVSLLDEGTATQRGIQQFFVMQAGGSDQLVETSKFYRVWKKVGGIWKLANESDRIVNVPDDDKAAIPKTKTYIPVDRELYNKIVQLDSILFDAYNNCKMDVSEELYSDSLEFFHDKGGLSTSKKGLMEALKNNICGKVTRHLVPGSIEVSPIPGYGAVEIGEHGFKNNQEPNAPFKASRFVIVWQYKNEKWQLTKVISLH